MLVNKNVTKIYKNGTKEEINRFRQQIYSGKILIIIYLGVLLWVVIYIVLRLFGLLS